jgi:hypothetical protein
VLADFSRSVDNYAYGPGRWGANLIVLDQAIDTTTPAGRLIFHLMDRRV